MDQIMNFVEPKLLIVAVVLYFVGMALKKTMVVKNKLIPLILGGAGIFICGLHVFGSGQFDSLQAIFAGIFAAVTQGILVAGLSTYVNQVIKQLNKSE